MKLRDHLNPDLKKAAARYERASDKYRQILKETQKECTHLVIEVDSGVPPYWYCMRCGDQHEGWTPHGFEGKITHFNADGIDSKLDRQIWLDQRPP